MGGHVAQFWPKIIRGKSNGVASKKDFFPIKDTQSRGTISIHLSMMGYCTWV